MLSPQAELQLNARLAKDPLSEPSLKSGKQLLITGAIALLLVVYSVRVPKIGEISFDTPQSRGVLIGALAVLLLYLLGRFLIVALYDLTQWYTSSNWIAMHNWYGPIQDAKEARGHLQQLIDETQPPLDERKLARTQQLLTHVDDVIRQSEERWKVAKAQAKTLNGLLLAKVLFDLVAPPAFGGYAFARVSYALWPFLVQLGK